MVEVPVAVGDRVRNSQTLVTVYDQQQLEVRALIPNRYLAQLRQALNTDLHPQAHVLATGYERLQVPLARLASAVRAGSGGVDGYFALPEDSGLELHRNIALMLNLPPAADSIAVPSQAIFGLNAVFVIDEESRLERVAVERLGDTLDAEGNKLVAIRSAELSAGTAILATQLPAAITGLKVKAANSSAP